MRSRRDEPIEITEHLAELRSRIIRIIIYVAVGIVVSWIFFDPVYALLLRPINNVISNLNTKFLMTGITEPFMFRIQVCAIAGLVLAAPLITLELWGFVSPALTPEERRPILWVAPMSIVLFAAGVTATYLILPTTLGYLVKFLPPGAELRPSVSQSLIFVVKMFLAFGLLFELPVVLLFLGKVGIVTSGTLVSYWRQAVVIIAVLAAVLTPSGDFFTMLVMAIPVIFFVLVKHWVSANGRTSRMNIESFIELLRTELGRQGQLVHLETIQARSAIYGELSTPLSQPLQDALLRRGIEHLYAHQAEAINVAHSGQNVVVVTGTASGKSLCYNIPVMESILADRRYRALYIFPTKALAQDQLCKLREFDLPHPLKAATYDGDTPLAERRAIKTTAQVVLTNPDMLHVGILPYHTTWANFFRNLKYVVIDEIHSYRGVFGSHVGNVIRRLRRICAHYGSDPQFICASATIANAEELINNLTGVDAHIVRDDTSPLGQKTFVFWNPPFIEEMEGRRSPSSEATSIFAELITSNIRSIVFTQSRKQAELIYAFTKAKLEGSESFYLADKIMAYRAGYLPEERRAIERRLFQGELLGVTSTTALELGVDIGGLDAAVLTGYPGTIASTWQQAGRAGRGLEQSLAVLIALDNPLDQFLMQSPDYFFRENPERAIIDTQNPYILSAHALCAAYEIPLSIQDVELFGERLYEVLAVLGESEQLRYRMGRWFWKGTDYPARQVSIRSASSDIYEIIDTTKTPQVLGSVDAASAFVHVHPGAIYLHAGETYLVEKLDIAEKTVYVNLVDVSYYTTPDSINAVQIEQELIQKPFYGGEAYFGNVEVTEQVIGYKRHKLFGEAIIGRYALDLPPLAFSTQSVWITVSQEIRNRLIGRNFDLAGAIHAIEHASIGILPLFAMCDRQDIGGVSHPAHPDLDGLAGIFIYDAYPGGVGISRTAYERLDDLFSATLRAIESCRCESGCPSCIQSPKCGSNNEPLDKGGAVFLLRELLSAPIASDLSRG